MILLSPAEIAAQVGVHVTTVYRWLGKKRGIKPDQARKLEKATGIPATAWTFPEGGNPYFTSGKQ